MLSSLLSLASAQTTELWAPTLPDGGELARSGMVVEDVDGDGELDFIAPNIRADGSLQILVQLSSDPGAPRIHSLAIVPGATHWLTLQVDEDAVNEVFVGLPNFDGGEFLVLNGEDLAADISTWTFLVEGDGNQGDRFGTHVELVDLTGDGIVEMVFSSPRDNALVVLETKFPQPTWEQDALAIVRGEGFVLTNPFTVIQDRDGDGHSDLLLSTDEGVGWLGSSTLSGELVIEHPNVVGGFTTAPLALETIPDVDGDGLDDVAWLSSDSLVWLSPENGVVSTWPLKLTGDVLGTTDGVWVSDGGLAKYYPLVGAVQTFEVDGATLGAALRNAGDLDGDGCDEVYASAPERGAVYTLQASCDADTGEPTDDTGDDTGQDSAVDTAAPDDSADDTGECVPEFGWSCSSSPGGGGLFGVLLVLLGALARWRFRD